MVAIRSARPLGFSPDLESIPDKGSLNDGTLVRALTPSPSMKMRDTQARTKFAGPVLSKPGLPRVKVASNVSIKWDVAELGGEVNSPTGGGKMHDHSRVCSIAKTSSFYALYSKKKVYNKVCGKQPLSQIRRKYKAKYWKDLGPGIVPMPPTVSIRYNKIKNVWTIESLTAYAVVRWADPAAGFHPICGKNVTINKSDGIRGNPPTSNPNAKGYYVDVAKNLSLYKGAVDKPFANIFWWVPGATERHEKAHLEYSKKEFKNLSAFLLRQTALKLEKELRLNRINPVNQEQMEYHARYILDGEIQFAKNSNLISVTMNETVVSNKTAQEFKDEAAKILKWGKAEEAKRQKTHP